MSGPKKIRGEMRIFNPGGTGQKSGHGEQQCDSQKCAANKSKGRSQKAVDKP